MDLFVNVMVSSRGIEKKSYLFFEAGKQREGWFTNQDLVNQLKDITDLIILKHPNKDVHLAFDNSMTHRKKAPDGLDAKSLNLSDMVIYPNFIRKCARYSFRFMYGYHQGLLGPLLEYTVKKYSSHRRIPAFVLESLEKEFANNEESKSKKRKR